MTAAPATTAETRPPRPGEELDAEKLAGYLAEHLPGAGRDLAVQVEQFPGGHSNLTYLLRLSDGREMVLRRPPVGSKVKAAHDMGREYRVLSRLSGAWSKAPRPLLDCQDESVLGCHFYLMEPVRGLILRREPPPGLVLDRATARAVCHALVDGLVELHAIDYQAIGLGDLGKPDGYVERQVRGWTERYAGSQTDEIPSVSRVAGWLAEHMPVSGPPSLIHNDFKFDSFGPTVLDGMLTRAQVAERYAEKSGRSVDHIVFYFAFGLFKTAVVVQQIYYRWKQGLTQDARFAALIHAVGLLCDRADLAITQGEI
jgi:aminoglycoside phosphotransferase (APT) family kinase protein